ncbi:uncharacterized protein LOC143922448 isoform X2 [Arctopsyche grandis]|uniref:uncharacterized protein LOC143922448 isoform X2 n=1 Tax=Arctopsyche grandis TaxID=121162 RepID=UPI00406D9176
MDDDGLRLERVCRSCLREASPMHQLSTPGCDRTELPLAQMLVSVLMLQISENDGLPYQICSHCTYQLSSAFTFKQMCQESDKRLKQYLSKTKTKLSKTILLDGTVQHVPSDKVKEEASQICNSNGIIDFNIKFNPDVPSIKIERVENQNSIVELDDKPNLSLNSNSDETSLNSNEKCTQTKFSDILQTLYSCSECTKKFSSLIGVTNHLKWRHSVQEVFSCKDCDKIYINYSQFRKHLLDVHKKEISEQPTDPPTLECQICKKSYQHSNQLKRHMLIHGKKKIFNCDKCQHGYNKVENYEKHKAVCVRKLFNCLICNKMFAKSETLKHHMEVTHLSKGENQDSLKNGSISNTSRNTEIIENVNASENSCEDFNETDMNIKEEPLDELLEEAERETRMLNDDSLSGVCNNQDDDFPSLEDFSEGINSDNSEYLESYKVKRKVGRPCKKNKKFKFKLLKHNNENDSPSLKYHCTLCPRRLSSNVGLKIHMAKHYSDQGILYTCEYCGKGFTKSVELKRHERTHTSIKQFKCNSCDKSFHRQDNLARHMWQHMDNKPHQCDKCNKSFIRIEHLERHNMALHSGKMKNPKTAFCSICKRGFTTEKYLETHMRMHTGDKTFTCKVCDKSFNTKWHLKEHSKWHSAEKPFLCSECGQRFIRNDYLITHMRRHNGEKPYKCRYCGKGFPRATDLTVHERYHTGEKTHLCTVCGKGFQRQYNLTVHLRVHTGEKPYVCSYCGKRFAQGNDLKSHIRRHTGERFNCEICGEGFIQGYHLTQHKRSIHGLQCVSHIRRVEKHLQTSSQNQSKIRSRSPQSADLPASADTDIQQSDLAVGSEVDLSQRSLIVPPLMPIVPLALFPPMHSRI